MTLFETLFGTYSPVACVDEVLVDGVVTNVTTYHINFGYIFYAIMVVVLFVSLMKFFRQIFTRG